MHNQKYPPTPEKLLKKEGRDIRQMFASIAPTYDLLNSLLSLGFDARWRKRVVELAEPSPNARVLDLCAGTAELALTFAQKLGPVAGTDPERFVVGPPPNPPYPPLIKGGKGGFVVASDFCWEMLELASKKLKETSPSTLEGIVAPTPPPSPGGRGKGEGDTLTLPSPLKGEGRAYRSATACPVVLVQADALCLPFPDESFDVASVAFGIRNVSNLTQGLKEMVRVVKPGGKVVILEFSLPAGPVFSRLYNFYFNTLLPWVGNSIAPGRLRAYSYLPASVVKFARPEELKREMESCGLTGVESHPLTLGIVTVYAGKRP